jgi:hypothetical protein
MLAQSMQTTPGEHRRPRLSSRTRSPPPTSLPKNNSSSTSSAASIAPGSYSASSLTLRDIIGKQDGLRGEPFSPLFADEVGEPRLGSSYSHCSCSTFQPSCSALRRYREKPLSSRGTTRPCKPVRPLRSSSSPLQVVLTALFLLEDIDNLTRNKCATYTALSVPSSLC